MTISEIERPFFQNGGSLYLSCRDKNDKYFFVHGWTGKIIFQENVEGFVPRKLQMRDAFPYAIECKNQEAMSIWSAIKQCETNANKEKLAPLLIIKRNHTPPYVVMQWDFFLHLLAPGNLTTGMEDETAAINAYGRDDL